MPASTVEIPFPKQTDYARTLFEEAVRHFHDSKILHENHRYAASITSASKAVEMSLKSLLMLDAATTLIPNLFQTHRVYQNILYEYKVYKTTHDAMLDAYDTGLRSSILELEGLTPDKPDPKDTNRNKAINTEYPFFVAEINKENKTIEATALHAPGTFFNESDSARHLDTAKRLLAALQAIYSDIQQWNINI